jgi:mono/diheme cytochrome c family protein
MKTLLIALLIAVPSMAVDVDAAKKEEQRECVACHGLRFIHTQRLSKAAWQKELDKMAGWGAEIKDKQLLLDYLSTEYGDSKPIPPAAMSADGVKK